ncbi:hypothetical protein [Rhizobium leguminosarum]|uniref:hypothetical protein n=1 Tax=Rhizobium leguminosarum TaxID=384 RepID=UPI0015D9BAC2|nr:hypothetical protein [Rhizobium leguminosarum]NZD54184.1 hypothetical protein [Rhizobium leguminosarum]
MAQAVKQVVPPALNLHIEPKNPIELEHMLTSLAALGRRFQSYAKEELDMGRGETAKLYISSIKPGSIDISLIPDFFEAGKHAAGAIVAAGAGDVLETVKGFAESIQTLFKTFNKPVKEADAPEISVRDCDDAVNIVKPIAEAGGTQTFNVNNVQGNQVLVFTVGSAEASRIMDHALHHRETLLLPETETRKSVALVWQKIDRSEARTAGATSPDKGRIEEIDPRAKSILFHEDVAEVKSEIMGEALLQMVYYVDVEIVRVDDKIKAYRVVGYHGKEPIDEVIDV